MNMKKKKKIILKDYSIDMLPNTRKEQFLDLLRTRSNVIGKIMITTLVFALPILISFGFKYFLFLPTGKVTHENDPNAYLAFFRLTNIIFDAIYSLFIVVFSIGLAGIFHIFKKIAWGQSVSFFFDLRQGIKENAGPFIVISIFFALFRFVSGALANLISNDFIRYIPFAIYLIFVPILFMAITIQTIYKNTIKNSLVDGFAYVLKKFLHILIFLAILIVFNVGNYLLNIYLGNPLIGGAFVLISLVIIFPLYLLAWYLYSLSLFDEFTNKKYYPECYKRGLRGSKELTKKRTTNFLLRK